MKETTIEKICDHCGKAFRLFSDDASRDETICWNFCPHCGKRNDFWLRFLSKDEAKQVPIGIGAEEAYKLSSKQKDEAKP